MFEQRTGIISSKRAADMERYVVDVIGLLVTLNQPSEAQRSTSAPFDELTVQRRGDRVLVESWHPVDVDSDRRVQVGSRVAAVAGTTAIGVAAIAWLVPGVIRRVAVPLMLPTFSLAFVLMVAAIGRRWQNRSWQMTRLPARPYLALLVCLAPIAVWEINSAFSGTDGLSQHERSSDPDCEWPIGDRLRTVCVSHEKWLRTGDSFVQSFLAGCGLMLLVDAALLSAVFGERTPSEP